MTYAVRLDTSTQTMLAYRGNNLSTVSQVVALLAPCVATGLFFTALSGQRSQIQAVTVELVEEEDV